MKKIFVAILLLNFVSISIVEAQITIDTINSLLDSALRCSKNQKKINLNHQAVNLLSQLLINTQRVDSLSTLEDRISILRSKDKKVEIFTWGVELSDGSFRYFGLIWYKKDKKSKPFIFILKDKRSTIKYPENQILMPEKWYGCIYYEIITEKYGKNSYYTLIGWDGNNRLSNKKIIDVLYFKRNLAKFGGQFVLPTKKVKRLIYEYSEQAVMTVRWDKKLRMIVMDHLAPSKPQFAGLYQYYGPDFTYDGLKFSKGKWILKENIVVKNPKPKKNKTE